MSKPFALSNIVASVNSLPTETTTLLAARTPKGFSFSLLSILRKKNHENAVAKIGMQLHKKMSTNCAIVTKLLS